MAGDQSNRYLLESLGPESDLLKKQQRQFPRVFNFKDSEIYCFYETKESNTAIQVSLLPCPGVPILTVQYGQIDGKWVMKGKPEILLGSGSASHVRSEENDLHDAQPLKKNHSSLVKFSRGDQDYYKIYSILRRFTDRAVDIIQDRFESNGAATSSSGYINSCKPTSWDT